MAGQGLSAGSLLRRLRHQLRGVLRGGRAGRALPLRHRGRRNPGRDARGRRLRLALLPAEHRTRPVLRLPGARPPRPGPGAAMQPEQAASRPLRQGHRRPLRLGPVAVRLQLRRARQSQRRRLGRADAEVRRDQPVLRLGGRPPAAARVRRQRDLRGARQGAHRAASGHPGGPARNLLGHRASGDHRPPEGAGGHGNRADARASLRQRLHPDRQGALELLGLQHDRLLRPGQQVLGQHHAGRAGAGVQGHGAGPARGGYRGDPRRRLQPHRRGQPHGAHAELPRYRQRRLLPPGRRRQAVLHGLHRDGQQPQRRSPALAAADHGLPPILGDRNARRRIPVRPGRHPGPRVLRRRPAERVLRTRATGSDGQPGQAHRRALGHRARRLPGR